MARPPVGQPDRRRMELRKGILGMNNGGKIQTGDWVGSTWTGPEWTPYAQAIADNYATQIPWFHTQTVDLAPTPARITTVTRPQQHDVLIFGMHRALTPSAALEEIRVYVQITHQATGIPWAIPNVVPFIPLAALGGSNDNLMAVTKLPEAFFLPKHTQLKFDWSSLSLASPNPVTLTLAGVQLMSPRDGGAPENITMPDGAEISVGSRLPLFLTIGLGRRGGAEFIFPAGEQAVQYLPPIECHAEIHDATLNFGSLGFPTLQAIEVKTTVMGVDKHWTPYLSPLLAQFGIPAQVYPQMPFVKPYLLPKSHKLQISMRSANLGLNVTQGLLTFRGVRLCEY